MHYSPSHEHCPILIEETIQCLRNQPSPPHCIQGDRPRGLLLSDPLLPQQPKSSTDNSPDTNVRAGLWSITEVQLGFICANLPHTKHLVVRCFQRWRPRIGTWHSGADHASPRNYSNCPNARTRSHRDTAGFQNLGSQSRSTAKVKAAGPVAEMDAERGYTSREEASIGTYDSDHELVFMGAPCESNVGRVEVRTEMRQEMQRIASPEAYNRERKWGSDTVSTEISAKGPLDSQQCSIRII